MSNLTMLERSVRFPEGAAPLCPTYVFGMHKGGSTMLHNFFEVITGANKLCSLNPSGVFYENGISDAVYTKDESCLPVFCKRMIYFGFRYVPIFMLKNKRDFINSKSIVLVRDPRDCVVSAFYSFLKSHHIPSQDSQVLSEINKERKKHEDSSIDEYCLSEVHRFSEELAGYALFSSENVKFYRYEDIIFEKRKFFEDVLYFLGVNISGASFDMALNMVDVFPEKEDVTSHIRNVTPGNFKLKLKKTTIDKITSDNRSILQLYGYL